MKSRIGATILLSLAGAAMLAPVAGAHNALVSAACSGESVIWTVSNDYASSATVTATIVNGAPTSFTLVLPSKGSVSFTTSHNGNATATVKTAWKDGFNQTVAKSFGANCMSPTSSTSTSTSTSTTSTSTTSTSTTSTSTTSTSTSSTSTTIAPTSTTSTTVAPTTTTEHVTTSTMAPTSTTVVGSTTSTVKATSTTVAPNSSSTVQPPTTVATRVLGESVVAPTTVNPGKVEALAYTGTSVGGPLTVAIVMITAGATLGLIARRRAQG